MITITFPDGNQRSYESGTTAMDVAKSISHGLARNILSGSFDGNTIELNDPLTTNGTAHQVFGQYTKHHQDT